MFGDSSFWPTALFLVFVAVVLIYTAYRAKKLTSPHREIFQLRSSIILAVGVGVSIYFSLPLAFYYTTYSSHIEIKTLDEAIAQLKQQEDTLRQMGQDISRLREAIEWMLLTAFVILLPAFYGTLTRIFGPPSTDPEEMTRLNLDKF